MSALLASLLSMLPRVLLSLVSHLVTEKFVTRITGRVVMAGLERLAKITTNKVDDVTVDDIRQTLEKAGVIEQVKKTDE